MQEHLTPISDPFVSNEFRREVLGESVGNFVRAGYRVESQSGFQAVVVRGHRPNHLLHLILTIFTLGLWLPVWIIVALASGEKRKVLAVNSEGYCTAR